MTLAYHPSWACHFDWFATWRVPRRYRCTHCVEALQWDGISRDALAQWHQRRTGYHPVFLGDGAVSVYLYGETFQDMKPTEWLVWFQDGDAGGNFSAMSDASFRDEYEPA